ncbi:MAG: DUF2203 family protein [Gemmataceae bacterium]
MSGFIEKRASGASERASNSEPILTWHGSRAMLPLVERIARDVIHHHTLLATLRPELSDLDRNRLKLAWPQRSRRYQLEEEIRRGEEGLKTALTELGALGVTMLDPLSGLVGFPTLVNQRRAYFTWKPGEAALEFWSYAGDRVRRPVPEEWTRPENEPRARPRTRARKK